MALGGIAFLAVVLIAASALNMDLGASAFGCGLLICAAIAFRHHRVVSDIGGHISWSVVPLVAGLFVIVQGVNSAGALSAAVQGLQRMEKMGGVTASLASSFGVALISNLMNNLPSGLIGGAAAVKAAHSSHLIQSAVLIGVDLGPNLSVSGSLATIRWLIAIRRAGQEVKFLRF
jgi:arsenical pump membrane protein